MVNTAGITIKAPGDDKNREADTLVIRVYGTESSKELGMTEIEVADNNMLPMVKVMVVDDMGKAVAPQPESLKEGGSVQIMAMVVDDKGKEMKAGEDLMVSLMPAEGSTAGMRDYSLSTHPIPVKKGQSSSMAVTLMAEEDDMVETETLMFDATVSGDATKGEATRSLMGVLSLMIEDATQELVWAKSEDDVKKVVYDAKTAGTGDDEMFNPGEKIAIMAGSLFNAAKGATVTYTAKSDKTDVASTTVGSDGTVMVMAEDMVGMANITITAHGSMSASGVMILDQTDPAEASIMFPVEVMLEALSLTLMEPEEMNIVEGGDGAMVKVMANRAVTEKVEVKLMRERSMSDADDMDFELMPAMITIEAGKMEGSTTVKATADDMDEHMEELVLYAMAGDMEVEGHAKLYIWDASVPALPVVAQFLLTAFLAVGGYRRFRRR